MGTAIAAGLTYFGVSAVTAAAIGSTVVTVAAYAAVAYAGMELMAPDSPEAGGEQTQLGDKGMSIDKTQMQATSEIGKLELGESAKDKKKRKKGKAAFKIALDKEKEAAAGDTGTSTGVQVQQPKTLGVQL